MIIYVDISKHCHLANDGTMRAVETDAFNGKCKEFVEGYCYDDSNGGIAIYPWRNYAELAELQAAVDRTQAEADEELAALIEEIYQNDLEMMEE